MTALALAHRRMPQLHALIGRLFDRSRAQEEAAAARYWAAIGHDMPLQDRAPRLRQLAGDSPTIKIRRRPGVIR